MLKFRGANLWDSQRIHDLFSRLVIGYGMPEVYDLAAFTIFLKELDDFDDQWYKSWKISAYRHQDWHWKFLQDPEAIPTYPEMALVDIAHRVMELSPANFYVMGQRALEMRNVVWGPNLAFLREFSGLTDEEIGRSVFNYPPWANRLGHWVRRPESIPLAAVVLLDRVWSGIRTTTYGMSLQLLGAQLHEINVDGFLAVEWLMQRKLGQIGADLDRLGIQPEIIPTLAAYLAANMINNIHASDPLQPVEDNVLTEVLLPALTDNLENSRCFLDMGIQAIRPFQANQDTGNLTKLMADIYGMKSVAEWCMVSPEAVRRQLQDSSETREPRRMQEVTLWRILTNQYWWNYIRRSPFVQWSFSDLIEQINLLEIKAKTELGLEAHVLGRWKRGRRPPETAKYLFAEMLSIARQKDTLSKFGIAPSTDEEAINAALEVAQIWSALKDPSFSTWEPTYTWLTHFKQEMAQWLYSVIGTVTQRGVYQDELEAE